MYNNMPGMDRTGRRLESYVQSVHTRHGQNKLKAGVLCTSQVWTEHVKHVGD